ncbi:hypothetical protein V2J09_019460 [Rumex salicifolius]
MGSFDLEDQFAFYGAYHSNPINIFIHMVFVWPIFYTSLVLFYFAPFNVSFLFAAMYALFYIKWDKKAGSLAALLCFLCWLGSCALASRLGYSVAWKNQGLICNLHSQSLALISLFSGDYIET